MSEWHRVASISEVPPGTSKVIEVGGSAVALFNADGTFYALTNTCPHQGGPLGEGTLEGKEVACPWHGWTYDVSSGEPTSEPTIPAETYPVKVEGDDISIQL